jgi:Cu-processing system ATP-binding protein
VIQVEGLRKAFGRVEALKGVTAGCPRGRITALVGPNGSGKTTLMKSLLGLVRPDEGLMRIGGRAAGEDPVLRLGIGYMPQVPHYPDNLTVDELLELVGGVRAAAWGPGAEEMWDWPGRLDPATPPTLFDLAHVRARRLRGLSGGTLQRVGAELAWRSGAPLLILDEPTAGLDPLASGHLKDRLREDRARGRTVLVSSHVLADLQELADHVIFLLDGRVRYEGALEDLLALAGEDRLERAVAALMRREAA